MSAPVLVIARTLADARRWANSNLDDPQTVEVCSTERSLLGRVTSGVWILPGTSQRMADSARRCAAKSQAPVWEVTS